MNIRAANLQQPATIGHDLHNAAIATVLAEPDVNGLFAAYLALVNVPDWSDETPGTFDRHHKLVHGTEGYEPAGSVARWTPEYWAHVTDGPSCTYGHRFNTEQEARDHYEQFTAPIEGVTA